MYSETLSLPPELMEAAKKAAMAKRAKAKKAAPAKKPAAKPKARKA
jgi:hypothetical protein